MIHQAWCTLATFVDEDDKETSRMRRICKECGERRGQKRNKSVGDGVDRTKGKKRKGRTEAGSSVLPVTISREDEVDMSMYELGVQRFRSIELG